MALGLGPLQCGAAITSVEQLGVGLGSQQGLHARLLPFASGHNQGGLAIAGLPVRVGRVLTHERGGGGAEVGKQVNARSASLQQLPHHLQVAEGCGGMQQAKDYGPAVNSCRTKRVHQPSPVQPSGHRLQLTPPG
eukprot:scaffold128002_cov57-Phaeocystis_antarctica.AAC.1